eukprot:RCo022011
MSTGNGGCVGYGGCSLQRCTLESIREDCLHLPQAPLPLRSQQTFTPLQLFLDSKFPDAEDEKRLSPELLRTVAKEFKQERKKWLSELHALFNQAEQWCKEVDILKQRDSQLCSTVALQRSKLEQLLAVETDLDQELRRSRDREAELEKLVEHYQRCDKARQYELSSMRCEASDMKQREVQREQEFEKIRLDMYRVIAKDQEVLAKEKDRQQSEFRSLVANEKARLIRDFEAEVEKERQKMERKARARDAEAEKRGYNRALIELNKKEKQSQQQEAEKDAELVSLRAEIKKGSKELKFLRSRLQDSSRAAEELTRREQDLVDQTRDDELRIEQLERDVQRLTEEKRSLEERVADEVSVNEKLRESVQKERSECVVLLRKVDDLSSRIAQLTIYETELKAAVEKKARTEEDLRTELKASLDAYDVLAGKYNEMRVAHQREVKASSEAHEKAILQLTDELRMKEGELQETANAFQRVKADYFRRRQKLEDDLLESQAEVMSVQLQLSASTEDQGPSASTVTQFLIDTEAEGRQAMNLLAEDEMGLLLQLSLHRPAGTRSTEKLTFCKSSQTDMSGAHDVMTPPPPARDDNEMVTPGAFTLQLVTVTEQAHEALVMAPACVLSGSRLSEAGADEGTDEPSSALLSENSHKEFPGQSNRDEEPKTSLGDLVTVELPPASSNEASLGDELESAMENGLEVAAENELNLPEEAKTNTEHVDIDKSDLDEELSSSMSGGAAEWVRPSQLSEVTENYLERGASVKNGNLSIGVTVVESFEQRYCAECGTQTNDGSLIPQEKRPKKLLAQVCMLQTEVLHLGSKLRSTQDELEEVQLQHEAFAYRATHKTELLQRRVAELTEMHRCAEVLCEEGKVRCEGLCEEASAAQVSAEKAFREVHELHDKLRQKEEEASALSRTLQLESEARKKLQEDLGRAQDELVQLQLSSAQENLTELTQGSRKARARARSPSSRLRSPSEPPKELGTLSSPAIRGRSTQLHVRRATDPAPKDAELDLCVLLGLRVDTCVTVTDTTPDGQARGCGLRRHDLLVQVGGKPVASLADIRAVFARANPGDRVHFKALRCTHPVAVAGSIVLPDKRVPKQGAQGATVPLQAVDPAGDSDSLLIAESEDILTRGPPPPPPPQPPSCSPSPDPTALTQGSSGSLTQDSHSGVLVPTSSSESLSCGGQTPETPPSCPTSSFEGHLVAAGSRRPNSTIFAAPLPPAATKGFSAEPSTPIMAPALLRRDSPYKPGCAGAEVIPPSPAPRKPSTPGGQDALSPTSAAANALRSPAKAAQAAATAAALISMAMPVAEGPTRLASGTQQSGYSSPLIAVQLRSPPKPNASPPVTLPASSLSYFDGRAASPVIVSQFPGSTSLAQGQPQARHAVTTANTPTPATTAAPGLQVPMASSVAFAPQSSQFLPMTSKPATFGSVYGGLYSQPFQFGPH